MLDEDLICSGLLEDTHDVTEETFSAVRSLVTTVGQHVRSSKKEYWELIHTVFDTTENA